MAFNLGGPQVADLRSALVLGSIPREKRAKTQDGATRPKKCQVPNRRSVAGLSDKVDGQLDPETGRGDLARLGGRAAKYEDCGLGKGPTR